MHYRISAPWPPYMLRHSWTINKQWYFIIKSYLKCNTKAVNLRVIMIWFAYRSWLWSKYFVNCEALSSQITDDFNRLPCWCNKSVVSIFAALFFPLFITITTHRSHGACRHVNLQSNLQQHYCLHMSSWSVLGWVDFAYYGFQKRYLRVQNLELLLWQWRHFDEHTDMTLFLVSKWRRSPLEFSHFVKQISRIPSKQLKYVEELRSVGFYRMRRLIKLSSKGYYMCIRKCHQLSGKDEWAIDC